MRPTAVLVATLGTASLASAQATYTSVSRTVSCNDGTTTQSLANTTPGYWNERVGFSQMFASAAGLQNSNLLADRIEFSISAGASNMAGAHAEASSNLTTTFSLAAPTPFELVTTFFNGTSQRMSLMHGSVAVFSFVPTSNVPRNLTGTLAPGTYEFSTGAWGFATHGGPPYSGQSSGTLYLPAPGVAAFALVGAWFARKRRR